MKPETRVFLIETLVPLGKRNGKIVLHICNSRLWGTLELFGEQQPFNGSLTCPNQITLWGKLKTALSTLDYTAAGFFTNETITFEIHTKKGIFPTYGTFYEENEGKAK
ncbi:MAG: hypothetical protein PHG02_05950 [Oscillospiraceae bacterium]|nr:hypothetical protein [Oscillospiraceae bacterium]